MLKQRHKLGIPLVLALLATLPLQAEPVTRDAAFRAASAELPAFFPGAWTPADEIELYDLQGDIAAYIFMFTRPEKSAAQSAAPASPRDFVAARRRDLTAAGKSVDGNNEELYGADRFASIVISADDTEPPVLRCFKGLPPQLAKEAEALALASSRHRGRSWTVRRYLMLSLFDEAYSIDAQDTAEQIVVDMRSRTVVTHADAESYEAKRTAVQRDPQKVNRCREAWARYQK
jgi:hypothetical protein